MVGEFNREKVSPAAGSSVAQLSGTRLIILF